MNFKLASRIEKSVIRFEKQTQLVEDDIDIPTYKRAPFRLNLSFEKSLYFYQRSSKICIYNLIQLYTDS